MFLNDLSSMVPNGQVEDFASEMSLKLFDDSLVCYKMVLLNQQRARTRTAVSSKNIFA